MSVHRKIEKTSRDLLHEGPSKLGEGEVLENRFRIIRGLGAGSHSVIYQATHLVTGKVVAIKWPVRAASFASVVQQARLAARVRHPNVVDIYDVGHHERRFFLVMEYVQGIPLSNCVLHQELQLQDFLTVFDAVLSGVNALHQCGVIHCDLKPANILVEPDDHGRPRRSKILDFGSAVIKKHDCTLTSASTPRAAQSGSERYMAPEQRAERGHVDERSDVYALGKILQAAAPGGLTQHADEAALAQVVAKACALDADARYQNVRELGDGLYAALAQRGDTVMAHLATQDEPFREGGVGP